jgi:transcriptional regulator with XRE-family HTH domain
METDMSRVGDQISSQRKEKGLTQKQLGKLVGASESFIDEVESGKRVMNDGMFSRITKALGQTSDKADIFEMSGNIKDEVIEKAPVKLAPKPVQQVWSDALESIMKTVSIHDYKMDKIIGTKQLPVISNKVEGFAKDKVFYLKVEDEDMNGFRIIKDDLALAFSTLEFEKEGIYFIEFNEKRVIRQIKKLDGDKILLISNKGSLITETAALKNIKILARLIRLEISL